MKLSIKILRILTLIMTLGLDIVCFRLNFFGVSQHYAVSLILTVLFILSLLMMSFLYGTSKHYLTIISAYFAIILITTSLAMIFINVNSLWKYVFLVMLSITFLVPFTPLGELMPIFDHSIGMIGLILIIYGLAFSAHKLGNRIKK